MKAALKIIILVLIGVLLGFVIARSGPVGQNNNDVTSYENSELGISFDYPNDWGSPETKIKPDLEGFTFEIAFDNGFLVGGVSDPYQPHGREPGFVDVTPDYIENGCFVEDLDSITTDSGIEGIYARAIVEFYDSCGFVPLDSSSADHYVSLVPDSGFQNIVIWADGESFSREQVYLVAESVSL